MRPQVVPFVERRHFLVFVVLCALGLGVTTVSVKSPGRLSPLERAGMSVTGPLARAGAGLWRSLSDAWVGVTAYAEAARELEAARTEIRDLRLLLSERRELSAENERLRAILGLAERVPLRTIPAGIVSRATFPDSVLVLDRGTDSGVAKDQAVIAPDGVVGKVMSVTRSLAKVQCVTDPDAGLAVLVGEGRRQANAIVTDSSHGLCRLRHVELLEDVRPGDAVVTSGLDQVYPKGLLVGTVESVESVHGVEQEIVVRPAVDLGRLEHVLVLAGQDDVAAQPASARELARHQAAGAAPERRR